MGPWLGGEEGPASGQPTLGEEEGLGMGPLLHPGPGAGGHQVSFWALSRVTVCLTPASGWTHRALTRGDTLQRLSNIGCKGGPQSWATWTS